MDVKRKSTFVLLLVWNIIAFIGVTEIVGNGKIEDSVPSALAILWVSFMVGIGMGIIWVRK